MKHALGVTAGFLIVGLSLGALAHEPHACGADFPETPAIEGHIAQSDIAAGKYSFDELVGTGRKLFTALYNICDGQGRPATTGGGDARAVGQPAFVRTSSPESNSCAGCHNMPSAGGAGDFVANVFVLAQTMDPVTFSVGPDNSNERNTLGMFGAGAIDMLAREMSADLWRQAQGLADGDHLLATKGVPFPVTIENGNVVASSGVDSDLVIKPFHQAGVVRSIREFTVNAFNHHHGMQAEERFDLNPHKNGDKDYDKDGVPSELSIGDITAVTTFQAFLPVPGRALPKNPVARAEVDRGERVFGEVGCGTCHVPALRLESPVFSEPYGLNPVGTFSDQSQSVAFDMTEYGGFPRLEKSAYGGAIVRAYSDLKRHNLCDAPGKGAVRFFCNETLAQGRPDQDGRPGAEFFITRKLWDVGSSAPYGHRGDLTTITEAILAHGGEGRPSMEAFGARSLADRSALVKFLKTLQVRTTGS